MLIMADDLTGAADCATVLGVQGLAVCLCLDVPASTQEGLSYSVNLGTRACEEPQAVYEATKKALLALSLLLEGRKSFNFFDHVRERGGFQESSVTPTPLPSPPLKGEGVNIYFKVDSTWRSDAVATALAGVDTFKAPFVLLCPAFPQEGRTIINGIAYLHGVPLHETPLKNDPQHPIQSSDVQVMLETQARALNRDIRILKGKQISIANIEDALNTSPQTSLIVVPDVETPADLTYLAELVASFKEPPLCMGSAGLLEASLRGGFQESNVTPTPQPCPPLKGEGVKQVQVISGSLNPTTIQQVEMLQAHHPEIKVLDTASWGTLTDWHERLKEAVAPLLEAPTTITLLCGGETAEAVLAQAGVSQLKWVNALSRTCSLWQAIENDGDSRYWVLKSGNMGEADLLLQLVKELTNAFQIPPAKHL
jgi:uncharacterized protein YgbK (DUF1537 family)